MTDLYELLVNMSLCEDDVDFLQPSFQRDATPPPCMEIDMEDLEELPCPPQEEESDSDSKATASADADEESAKTTTEESPEIKVEEEDEEEGQKEESFPPETTDVERSSLETILNPLHQETPIPEAELAAILDSLLRHKSPEPCQKDTDFPSVDRFLQIMEVISQLTGTVMKPTSDSSKDDSAKITSLTPQHLAVIMNLRSLLDYATKVLCIKSIETPSIKDTAMRGGMELVV